MPAADLFYFKYAMTPKILAVRLVLLIYKRLDSDSGKHDIYCTIGYKRISLVALAVFLYPNTLLVVSLADNS